MSAEAMSRAAYETWHDRYDVDREADAPWHRLVKRHLDPEADLRGKRILEIGCGRGGFACWLAAHSALPAQVVAADFAETAVSKGAAWAAELRLNDVVWRVADVQALPFSDGDFDTVVSCETIEHVADPRQALRELARVLKPGGRLFLTTPNYLGPMGLYRVYLRLRGRRYTEEGQPINHCLLLPRVRGWVQRTGLTVERTDGVGQYLPWPGRPPRELPWLDRPHWLMRWFGLHSLLVARKSPSTTRR
jgi:2-polyprenyl-3-methyl-5-hydroxy-6-metoxy-1,4-benzoquinol methylase